MDKGVHKFEGKAKKEHLLYGAVRLPGPDRSLRRPGDGFKAGYAGSAAARGDAGGCHGLDEGRAGEASLYDRHTELAAAYFQGTQDLDNAAKNIQNRVQLYLDENG